MEVVKEEQIGSGGFGSVYLCRDITTNRKYALKEIKYQRDEGVNCLIEIYMMSKAKHKAINRTIGISFCENELVIMQNVASQDLRVWREQNSPSEEMLKKIMHQITTALDYMHHHLNIIHGDIKLSNILCFPNNSFKLTDFSVSADIAWNNRKKSFCTATHRPPEVWLQKSVTEKLDIWSLGCTFHELIFNFKLFPGQCPGLTKTERSRKRNKIIESSLNAIYDWAEFRKETESLNFKKTHCTYLPLEKCDKYADNDMNNLMFAMLSIDPKERPSTKQIFQHSFFKGKNKNPNRNANIEYVSHKKVDKILNGDLNISGYLREHVQFLINQKHLTYWHDVAKHSYIIFEKYTSQQNITSSDLLHAACLYTAYNLVVRRNIPKKMVERDLKVSLKNLIALQKRICISLDFILY